MFCALCFRSPRFGTAEWEGGPVPEGRIKQTDQTDSIMVVEMPKYADDDGGQTE